MLPLHGWNSPTRGFLIGAPPSLERSAARASDVTRSACTDSDSPEMAYRAPDAPLTRLTEAPCFQARLTARNALFCAGSTSSAEPVPLMRPGGGTIAAAARSESNPMPGTLSNGAASFGSVML